MEKLSIGLLSALLVLSALTFLGLVRQEPLGGPRGSALESREASDQRAQQIGNLEIAIRNLKTTIDNLSRKIDDFPQKVVAAVRNATPAVAPVPGVAPMAGTAAPANPDLGTTIPEEGAEDFLEEPAHSGASPSAGRGTRPDEGGSAAPEEE